MTDCKTEELVAVDKQFVWHRFANMPGRCVPEHELVATVERHGALLAEAAGEVCREARGHGLLTRNTWETIVLLPPLCAWIDNWNGRSHLCRERWERLTWRDALCRVVDAEVVPP